MIRNCFELPTAVEARIREDVPRGHTLDAETVYGLLRLAGWKERDLNLAAIKRELEACANRGLIRERLDAPGIYVRTHDNASREWKEIVRDLTKPQGG